MKLPKGCTTAINLNTRVVIQGAALRCSGARWR